MKLSICMATFQRGPFLARTLNSILPQVVEGVEIVVVDGASPDETPEVMARYAALHPCIRYHRERENSGVDRDYDKAVGYATGEYCWLMTDDDLLLEGAVARVLEALEQGYDLVVANAEVRDVDLARRLQPRLVQAPVDREYGPDEWDEFFAEVANYLSFIGGVVIRRDLWLARDRASYYGSLFIHMGVIFQPPRLGRALLIAEPLLSIRYGNAMWTPRGFEIWLFKWPRLVWSFDSLSEEARGRVVRREPWRNPRILFYWRGLGTYSLATFRQYLAGRARGLDLLVALAIALVPAEVANLLGVLVSAARGSNPLVLYNLLRSPAATLSRPLARLLKEKAPGG